MTPQPSSPPADSRSARPADGMNQAMSVLSYLLGGLLVYGGLGWAGAHFLHVAALLPIGVVLGVGLSVYLIVRHYGAPGEQAVSTWIEQRNASQASWTRLAGRPPELRPAVRVAAATSPASATDGAGAPDTAEPVRRPAADVLRR